MNPSVDLRRRALQLCEEIAAADSSSLYRVSQLLTDRRRYEAFIAMYAVMRVIDDRVDNAPGPGRSTEEQLRSLEAELLDWRTRISAALQGHPHEGLLDIALADAAARFPVSMRVWDNFLDAMRWDVRNDRFETQESFLDYARGATAAPTTLFILILMARPTGAGRYELPELGDAFDVEACGYQLGVFAYIAHILRDVAVDLKLGARGRIYVSEADLRNAGLSEAALRRAVETGTTNPRLDAMIRVLVERSRSYEARGMEMAWPRLADMEPDCRFILVLIVEIYRHLLERIDAEPESVFRGEPIQTAADRERVMARAAAAAGWKLAA